MKSYKEDFSVTYAVFVLIISSYLVKASFIYFVKKFNSAKKKENLIVLLCSLLTITCSILYFFLVLYYKKYDTLLSSSGLCKSSNDMFKTVLIINKCFCNLIFAYRYKTVNNSGKKFVKKTLVFSAIIITISVFQVIFDHLYTVFILPIEKQECFHYNYDLKQHLVYIIVMVGCMFLTTVLQTGILVLTLRPIRNHVNNISSISNERMYSMTKRIFFCTLLFAASDFGLLILQLVMVKSIVSLCRYFCCQI